MGNNQINIKLCCKEVINDKHAQDFGEKEAESQKNIV